MGAKQSKRSVDISGKEAEGAGEVAAAGAGGEGRVEQLADADALKPQLNGDAHIHEESEKQKDLDSGTPENEKDATTEKEAKMQEEEKETETLTNGESEQKVENGESTPTPEDGKKPKKEKVKKKWSLRSISFSRKDKPKQEKKQKDEEPKTNGEPEKVPEETAEVVPEPTVTETAEEANTESESKEEKTPETPVTEPITNGSTTPVSPKDESPVVEEPPTSSPNIDRPELQPETQPEQLPVNGLSLEETSKETPENEKHEESKEEATADTTETVPEISDKKEVCVEQMPLIDSTPPPLPSNPPPSSVASFAATTMAPESTDASLANTADNANPPNSDPIANIVEPSPMSENELTLTQTVSSELPSPAVKEDCEEISFSLTQPELDNETKNTLDNAISLEDKHVSSEVETIKNYSVAIKELTVTQNESETQGELTDIEVPVTQSQPLGPPEDKADVQNEELTIPSPICDNVKVVSTEKINIEDNFDNIQVTNNEIKEISVISNHISDTEKQPATENVTIGDSKDATQNIKSKSKDSLGNLIVTIECNGNIDEDKLTIERKTPELITSINSEEIKNIESGRTATTSDDSMPPSLSEANESALAAGMASNEESESFPLPPSELCRSESEPSPPPPSLPEPASPEPDAPAHTPQDSLPLSDKLAELIPEVPDVPELNTETVQETTSDVAVTN